MAFPQLNPSNEGVRVLRLLASRRVQRRLCIRVAELAAGLALIMVLCHLMVILPNDSEIISDAIFNANTSAMIR